MDVLDLGRCHGAVHRLPELIETGRRADMLGHKLPRHLGYVVILGLATVGQLFVQSLIRTCRTVIEQLGELILQEPLSSAEVIVEVIFGRALGIRQVTQHCLDTASLKEDYSAIGRFFVARHEVAHERLVGSPFEVECSILYFCHIHGVIYKVVHLHQIDFVAVFSAFDSACDFIGTGVRTPGRQCCHGQGHK